VSGMRVAVVTGAARGIGAATTLALVRDGWAVLAVDSCAEDTSLGYRMATREQLGDTLSAARAAAGGEDRIAGWVADVRDADALVDAVADAEGRWGGLDAAIACAGVIAGGAAQWDTPIEAEKTVLDVDLGGVLNLARAAVPALLRRPWPRYGRFLAVASSAASMGLPNLAAYCAAKAGVTGLIRALAVELGGTGVTANAVSPGSTDTAMLAESARLYDLPGALHFAEQQPLGRLIAPEEVAAVLVFLAGLDSAAMTGAVVPVDGGLAL
jgi:SDR family mycofactocin-dependent oxidoreductase